MPHACRIDLVIWPKRRSAFAASELYESFGEREESAMDEFGVERASCSAP
jgi:hypothetical protein